MKKHHHHRHCQSQGNCPSSKSFAQQALQSADYLRPPSTQSRPNPYALADHQPVAEDIDGIRIGELDDPSFRPIIENIRPLDYTERYVFGQFVS
jgi:hypothetical protein